MKKEVYFYSSSHAPGPYESDTPDELKITDSMLTEQIVEHAVRHCASGRPPFLLQIPKAIAWDNARWAMNNPLFTLEIIPGKPDSDPSPLDSAMVHFDDTVAIIIARRYIAVDWGKCCA